MQPEDNKNFLDELEKLEKIFGNGENFIVKKQLEALEKEMTNFIVLVLYYLLIIVAISFDYFVLRIIIAFITFIFLLSSLLSASMAIKKYNEIKSRLK